MRSFRLPTLPRADGAAGARFSPSRLVLLERSEPALYTIERELREAWPSLAIVAVVVGDVGDRERMLSVFRGPPDEPPFVILTSFVPAGRGRIRRGSSPDSDLPCPTAGLLSVAMSADQRTWRWGRDGVDGLVKNRALIC